MSVARKQINPLLAPDVAKAGYHITKDQPYYSVSSVVLRTIRRITLTTDRSQYQMKDLVLSAVKGVSVGNQLVNEDETKFEYHHCGTSPLSPQ